MFAAQWQKQQAILLITLFRIAQNIFQMSLFMVKVFYIFLAIEPEVENKELKF